MDSAGSECIQMVTFEYGYEFSGSGGVFLGHLSDN
jgi:hypothetical protein